MPKFTKGNRSYLGREGARTKKATVHPSIRDLEWAAGFLEGEGSFSRSRNCLSGVGGQVVSAFQNTRQPLDRLLTLFGGAIDPVRQAYAWRVHGSRARGVMMILFPLLSDRRRQRIAQCLS